MTPSSIPRVRRAIAGINSRDARLIADECLTSETADDVENLVRERFTKLWPQLFSAASLPASRQANRSS